MFREAFPGNSRAATNNANTEPKPPNNTAASKATGMSEGNEFQGFPPISTGQEIDAVQCSNQSIPRKPHIPQTKQTHVKRDGFNPIAESNP
jgi:hypothetical protein